MGRGRLLWGVLGVLGVLWIAASGAGARGDEDSGNYKLRKLLSDGTVPAEHADERLVNPWGLARSPAGPWWVANNASSTATLHDAEGNPQSLMVAIAGAPTGAVFYGGEGFIVRSGNFSGAARFLFASEEGTISAWSSGVPSPAPSKEAIVVVDRRAARSVYKGLAIATGTPRGDLIYATDFRNRRVDVFNARFDHAGLGRGAFFDSAMPDNYAPFGIAHLGNSIFVTYAEQNDEKKDDVKGLGHGYVDQYDLEGRFIRRVATRGQLNSPWGLALAPHDFGNASGELLVGNFGDGRINTYDPKHLTCQNQYRARGLLKDQMGRPLSIDGLWALSFGNGAQAGPENTLFFSAGIHGEEGGLFGSIESDDACGDYTCD